MKMRRLLTRNHHALKGVLIGMKSYEGADCFGEDSGYPEDKFLVWVIQCNIVIELHALSH